MTILTPFVYLVILYMSDMFFNDPMWTLIVACAMVTWYMLGF